MQHSTPRAIRHSSVVVLDTAFRLAWYSQGTFGLSEGLKASARMKHWQPNDDSSRQREGLAEQYTLALN